MPVIKIRVACSKGTYIRTLCADIGEKLGCGGTMQSLLRTKVGIFYAENAVTLSQLEEIRDKGGLEELLYPVESAFEECPSLHIRPEHQKLLDNGNAFYSNQTLEKTIYPAGKWVKVYGDTRFYGIYACEEGSRRYKPVKMFLGE